MTRNQNQFQQGFTVTELLVVFLIMVLMAGLGIISWSQQTPRRNLTLAQNELITNIRKVQGYAISSRNIDGISSANFYVIKFEIGNSQYEVYGVDAAGTMSGVLETISLPQSISFSQINLVNQVNGNITNPECVYLIFNVIYGKTFLTGQDKCPATDVTNLVVDPPALARQSNYDLGLTFIHGQTSQIKAVYLDGQTGRVQGYSP